MKALNKEATAIMEKLYKRLTPENQHHIKLDNGRGFMPVYLETLNTKELGGLGKVKFISMAHYYEQNGDLMRDPDVVFMRTRFGAYYPISFQQDNMGIYQEPVVIDEGSFMVQKKLQASLSSFSNQWLKNIKMQQNL